MRFRNQPDPKIASRDNLQQFRLVNSNLFSHCNQSSRDSETILMGTWPEDLRLRKLGSVSPVYPGVPTFDFGRLSFSFLEYPKSQIFSSGRRPPSSNVFSSLMSRFTTPICDNQHHFELQRNEDIASKASVHWQLVGCAKDLMAVVQAYDELLKEPPCLQSTRARVYMLSVECKVSAFKRTGSSTTSSPSPQPLPSLLSA